MQNAQTIIDDVTGANDADLAAMMPEIKLEEFERDCGANDEYRKEGKRLIKDIKVFINGEYRALLSSRGGFCGKRGYHLFDIDHRPIHLEDNHWNSHNQGYAIGTKAEIIPTIQKALENDRIPNTERYAELRQADADKKAAVAKEIADRIADNLRRDAAEDLLAALKNLVNNWDKKPKAQQIIEWAEAEAAIAKAEGKDQ